MHNTLRSGVDLELTFKSHMRRVSADSSQVGDHLAVGASRGKDNAAPKDLRARAGQLVRSLLNAVVTRLEPTLYPLLFRLRRYFMASVEEAMQALKVKLQHEIRNQVAELSARLDRPVVTYCGPEEVLIRLDVGYVVCSPQDHATLIRLLEGTHERGTRQLIQRLLKPGDVFIDVGANIGVHTLAAARAMGGIGRIVAFEPCEPAKHLLEKSVALNGLSRIVNIHHAAVSGRTSRQLLLPAAASDPREPSSLPLPTDTQLAPIAVDCVVLDDVMAAESVVHLIRINARGAELEVLDGSRSLIRRNAEIALMVNFEPAPLRRTGRTTREWLAGFEALGLAPRVIDNETGVAESWSAENLEHLQSVNLLFARPGAAVWRKAEILP